MFKEWTSAPEVLCKIFRFCVLRVYSTGFDKNKFTILLHNSHVELCFKSLAKPETVGLGQPKYPHVRTSKLATRIK